VRSEEDEDDEEEEEDEEKELDEPEPRLLPDEDEDEPLNSRGASSGIIVVSFSFNDDGAAAVEEAVVFTVISFPFNTSAIGKTTRPKVSFFFNACRRIKLKTKSVEMSHTGRRT